ncbi:MAG: spore photoproduct lyase family protein [Planctomycetota bacterium]
MEQADCVELRERKTAAVEIFRTTPPKTVCPNFYVLAHANGCGFAPRCSYCYLKSSFPNLQDNQVFSNVDTLIRECSDWIDQDGLESTVLNTGNLSDSLTFEDARPLMAALIELFRERAEQRGRPHSLLVVTKGAGKACRPFFESAPCRNVVVSFSMNCAAAARDHEPGAPPVEARLEAAARLKALGWRVRVRVDPIIVGYAYDAIIGAVRDLKPERLTLGTLRAEANLEKHAPAGLFDALELRDDPKGMRRYAFPVRVAAYRPAVEALRGICPIGLCEETREMWDALALDTAAKSCNCGG